MRARLCLFCSLVFVILLTNWNRSRTNVSKLILPRFSDINCPYLDTYKCPIQTLRYQQWLLNATTVYHESGTIDISHIVGKTMLMMGNSHLRQVFLSLGCILKDYVTKNFTQDADLMRFEFSFGTKIVLMANHEDLYHHDISRYEKQSSIKFDEVDIAIFGEINPLCNEKICFLGR